MGGAILFVCGLAGFAICTFFFALFASHYFLVTIIDSTSGHDEVHFPDEGLYEWWWKPIFCLWILFLWIMPGVVVVLPLLFHSTQTFLIAWGVLVWFVFPLGVMSALFTRNWFFFMHPIILWRMLKHYVAFIYVHLITSLVVAGCAALAIAMITRSPLWGIALAFAIPMAILFYARQWGRFAWLSLHFSGRRRSAPEADPNLPRATAIYVDAPPKTEEPPPEESAPADDEEEDEWAVKKNPYRIIEDGSQPSFHESAPAPAAPVNAPKIVPPPVAVPEEDEWATDLNPYETSEHPTTDHTESADADKPVTATEYFDKRAKREKAADEKAKREAATNFMPKPSNKTPTFYVALLAGVWSFMINPRTIRVWINLVFLTFVELFFIYVMASFWPG